MLEELIDDCDDDLMYYTACLVNDNHENDIFHHQIDWVLFSLFVISWKIQYKNRTNFISSSTESSIKKNYGFISFF